MSLAVSPAWAQSVDAPDSSPVPEQTPSSTHQNPLENTKVGAASPEDSEHYVRIHRTGGLSPFSKIEWEIIVRGETPIAKHAKIMVGYEEPLHKLALLSVEEFEELWRKIEQNDGFILYDTTDAYRDIGQPTYEVEIRRGDMKNTFRVSGLSRDTDLRYREIVEGTIALVSERAGAIPFRNVFYDVGAMGWVDLDTRPRAWVFIDDRPINEQTPLFTYELPAGKHTVRLVAEEKGVDRVYEFTVQPGITTILNLDLK